MVLGSADNYGPFCYEAAFLFLFFFLCFEPIVVGNKESCDFDYLTGNRHSTQKKVD